MYCKAKYKYIYLHVENKEIVCKHQNASQVRIYSAYADAFLNIVGWNKNSTNFSICQNEKWHARKNWYCYFQAFLEKIQTAKIKILLRSHDGTHDATMDILRCTFVLCVCVVILCWGKSFFKNSLRIWKRFCSHNVCQSRNCRIHITCNASPILLMVNGQNYVAWHQLPDIRFYMRNIFSTCPYKTSW